MLKYDDEPRSIRFTHGPCHSRYAHPARHHRVAPQPSSSVIDNASQHHPRREQLHQESQQQQGASHKLPLVLALAHIMSSKPPSKAEDKPAEAEWTGPAATRFDTYARTQAHITTLRTHLRREYHKGI